MTYAMLRSQRPKNLDLRTIRLPLPGVVSILHRISGAGIFLLGIPALLSALDHALHPLTAHSPWLPTWLEPPLLWGLTWACVHHFCAGLRFLLLDIHRGTERHQARRSSVWVLVCGVLITLVIGGLLW